MDLEDGRRTHRATRSALRVPPEVVAAVGVLVPEIPSG